MLGPLPALLSDQMVGEISGQTLAPVSAPIDKDAIAPPVMQQLMRIGRMQNEREANDLLASNVNEGMPYGLPEVLDQRELGVRVRTEQPRYISRYCAVASR